jgi:hypothetical protein
MRDWRATNSTRYAKRPAMFVLQASRDVPAKRDR